MNIWKEMQEQEEVIKLQEWQQQILEKEIESKEKWEHTQQKQYWLQTVRTPERKPTELNGLTTMEMKK